MWRGRRHPSSACEGVTRDVDPCAHPRVSAHESKTERVDVGFAKVDIDRVQHAVQNTLALRVLGRACMGLATALGTPHPVWATQSRVRRDVGTRALGWGRRGPTDPSGRPLECRTAPQSGNRTRHVGVRVDGPLRRSTSVSEGDSVLTTTGRPGSRPLRILVSRPQGGLRATRAVGRGRRSDKATFLQISSSRSGRGVASESDPSLRLGTKRRRLARSHTGHYGLDHQLGLIRIPYLDTNNPRFFRWIVVPSGEQGVSNEDHVLLGNS